MDRTRNTLKLAALAASLIAGPVGAQAGGGAAQRADNPLKLAPRPTSSAITAEDLMTRVYIFADDSMAGREAGHPGHVRGTDYIARELARLGVKPMGENGTYFQNVPVMVLKLNADAAKFSVDGEPLVFGRDFHPFPGIQGLPLSLGANVSDAPIVFGGRLGANDAISAADAAGKLVVMLPPIGGPQAQPVWQAWAAADALRSYSNAAGLVLAAFEMVPPPVWEFLGNESMELESGEPRDPAPPLVFVTNAVAARMLGVTDLSAATMGQGTKNGSVMYGSGPPDAPTRNVVGIVEGSDPQLKNEMIVLSAHSDHDGIVSTVVDHDSLRFSNQVVAPMGAESSQPRRMTPDEISRLRAQLDSVRKLRPVRLDSIMNGADDDASGSMGLLEIAEYFATLPVKPKRSVLFVWVVAEEKGLFGSEYFTEHPTVPRDAMIANVNIDMIGRGKASDIADGGDNYLQLLGSRRLSTTYGDWVEEVNRRPEFGFRLDYQFDAPGHPQQYYCRSDHWNFARWGIPTVFFSTGSHVDYHMPTDEPQYLDYPKYAKVVQFVAAFAADVAARTTRPMVDKPKGDPHGACVQ